MKKRMRRLVAVLLAMAMVVQQGSTLGVLAVETEPMSESLTEAMSVAQESEKAEETQAIETQAPETEAPETQAPETEASETQAPETKTEETEASDQKAQTETAGETLTETEQATETVTEQVAEAQSELITETAAEEASEAVSETAAEAESEKESETEETVVLEASVMQEAYQETVENATVPMVRYTVKIANKAEKTAAEGVSLKVLLADALSYKKEDGETPELVSFESLGKAIEAAALGEELTEEIKTTYANGGVALWKNQTIAAGEEKTFAFCAEVKDGQTDVNALKNLWFVNGEAVAAEKIQWANTELLQVVEKELPSEFVCSGEDGMTVTAVVSDPSAFPEGTVLVAEPLEVTEEDIAAVEDGLEEGRQIAKMLQYDIRFEHDGQEIEPPEGVTVDVSIAYNNAVELGVDPEAAGLEMQVLHEKDNGEVEEVAAEATISEDGAMDGVQFTAESFSTYTVMLTALEGEISLSFDGIKDYTAGEFYLCLLNEADGQQKHIVLKVNVENGQISVYPNENGIRVENNVIKITKVYDQNGSEIQEGLNQGEAFKLEIFELKDTVGEENIKAIFSQKHNEEISKRSEDMAFMKKQGDILLGSGEKIVDIPEKLTVGEDSRIELQSIANNVAASKSTIVSSLGQAMKFGAFVWDYDQTADVEATIAAHTAEIDKDYNFMRQNEDVDNTIIITKHFKDQKGNPVKNQPVTIMLYRVADGIERFVAEKTETTNEEGNATFTFNNATIGGHTFLFGGTYTFREVINGSELKETGDKFSITYENETQQGAVAYGNKTIIIEDNGFNNYSYFDNVEDDTTLGKAREGSFVVLGSPAWENYESKLTGGKYGNAYVVQAGHEGFPQIDFSAYFGEGGSGLTGSLATASANIACMHSSDDTVVYYVKAKDLYKDMNFSSQGKKFIVVNVDTSGCEGEIAIEHYSIDGTPVSSDFGSDRSDTNVLWNLYNYNNSSLFTGSFTNHDQVTGTLLAPAANASVGSGNLGGRVIAHAFTGNQSEIHETVPDIKSSTESGSVTNILGELHFGSLTVKKSIEGALKAANLTEEQKQAIKFKLTKPDGTTEEFTYADMPGGSKTFDNLPLGEYTVTETNGNVDGYSVWTTYSVTGGKTTVQKDTTVEVTVTNKYSEDKGNLTVTKSIEGALAEKNLTDAQKRAITFELKKPDGTVATFTYADMPNGSKTFNDLPLGEYTVTETNGNLDGYTVETTYDVTAGKTTVKKDETAIVVVTNKYTQKKGSLIVKKNIEGALEAADLTEEQKQAIKFKLTKPDGTTEEFTYAEMSSGSKTFNDLPLGEYTVTETNGNVDGYTVETTYDVADGKTALTDKKMSAEVTVTNTYTQKKGNLTVKKSFAGDLAAADLTEEQKKAITFEVYGPVPAEGDAPKAANFSYFDMEGGSKTITDLVPGEYVVKETNGNVDGYTVVTTYSVTDGKAEVKAETTPAAVTVTNTYTQKTGSLKIKKNVTVNGTATTGTDVDGTYKFEVKDASGKKVADAEITIKNGASSETTVSGLVPGAYTVSELTDGLAKGVSLVGANDVTVTVSADETAEVPTAEFTNNLIVVKVSKTDVATGAELEGAHIQILDKDGKVVEEWDSTKEAHEVKGLKTGETYTLKETVAPDGYTLAAETTFTLNADGTVDSGKTTTKSRNGVLLVEDSFNKISIEKVDESGKALKGAKLVIKDKDGKAVGEPWTTDGTAHEITGLVKGSYTLSEIEAPEGYQVSEDIPFAITGQETAGQVITVTMTDKTIPKTDKRSLTVTKHLRLDGITSDVGIKDAVYYVALFSDEAKTQRVSDVKQIVFKNQTSSTVTFENLAKGTYYVGETDENGTLLISKMVNDKVIFYPEYDGTAHVEFEGAKSETASAEFTNVYMELTDGLYISGQITVTKKVLLNGEESASDDTYYAGVFDSEDMSDPLVVVPLALEGNSSTSYTVTDLPIGEELDDTRSYYVTETDENGTPLDPDAVTEFKISVDKSEIVLSADNSKQEVVITNSFTEEETETETETEVPKKAAPKTGDDTDFMRYLLLMALSAGICAVTFEEKRRRARRVRK